MDSDPGTKQVQENGDVKIKFEELLKRMLSTPPKPHPKPEKKKPGK